MVAAEDDGVPATNGAAQQANGSSESHAPPEDAPSRGEEERGPLQKEEDAPPPEKTAASVNNKEEPPKLPVCCFGLDIGSSSSVVAAQSGEIVRNELGGHASASLVAFSGAERLVGEAAVSQMSTNAANTIHVGDAVSANEALSAYDRCARTGTGGFKVAYQNDDAYPVSKEAALCALISKLARLALAHAEQDNNKVKIGVACPSCFTHRQRDVLRIACLAAARELSTVLSKVRDVSFRLVDAGACAREVYALKHARSIAEGATRTVACVDLGRRTVSVDVARYDRDGNATCLVSKSTTSSGGTTADLDAAMLKVVLERKLDAKVASTASPGSKKGARLLGGVDRARKLLSTMREAKITVENLGDDCDVTLSLTRDEVAEAAKDSVLEPLRSFLRDTLRDAGVDTVDAVELFGGGGRVALFRDIVTDVFFHQSPPAESTASLLGAKLDDATLARGAALLAAKEEADDEDVAAIDDAVVRAIAEEEGEMRRRDERVAAVAAARNRLETMILELRAALTSGRYPGNLLTEDAKREIDEKDKWLWEFSSSSEEEPGPETTHSLDDARPYVEAAEELDARVRAAAPAYFAAVEADKRKADQDLERAARESQQQQDDGDDDERRDDKIRADDRKLKFADRFRLVQKNKDEGTELFKGGNVVHAARRYKDALAHASKLSPGGGQHGQGDLTPDQERDLKRAKLDCNLNMALCWAKLDKLDQTIRSCDEALKLDDAHPKALYRRAAALELLKKFDDAKKDLRKALAVVPDDKALLALQKRVDAQIARQKKKEKDMWGKAFK